MTACFIIMPFDRGLDAFEKLLREAASQAGYDPIRGDDALGNSSILGDIWESIHKASVLIALLRKNNPNVLYELGLAHALGKPVVLIADEKQITNKVPKRDRVPADLGGVRILTYNEGDPFWGDKLNGVLIDTLKAVRGDPNRSIPEPFRSPRIGAGVL